MNKTAPAITLFVLAPVIAELLSASTPVSRAGELIVECLFYGPTALLIREVVRRQGWSWWSVVMLGLAMGTFEEGLLTQTLFNPEFMHLNPVYGNRWGINGAWMEFIIPYHAIWSISVPIVISEQLFPVRAEKPWLSRAGIWTMGVMATLGAILFATIFIKIFGFVSSPAHYALAASLVILFVSLSPYAGRWKTPFAIKVPNAWLISVTGFVAGAVLMELLGQVFSKQLPAWLSQVAGLLTAGGMIALVSGWVRYGWSRVERFHLAWGALFAIMLSGLDIVIAQKSTIDIIAQGIFIAACAAWFLLWRRRIGMTQRRMAGG